METSPHPANFNPSIVKDFKWLRTVASEFWTCFWDWVESCFIFHFLNLQGCLFPSPLLLWVFFSPFGQCLNSSVRYLRGWCCSQAFQVFRASLPCHIHTEFWLCEAPHTHKPVLLQISPCSSGTAKLRRSSNDLAKQRGRFQARRWNSCLWVPEGPEHPAGRKLFRALRVIFGADPNGCARAMGSCGLESRDFPSVRKEGKVL